MAGVFNTSAASVERPRQFATDRDGARPHRPARPYGSRVGWLTRLLLGDGKLKPELRAALEAEGLVLVEEGLFGWITYRHFKAPGRRFNGKVAGERLALAISEQRFVVYCRSGTVDLIDSPFTEPNLRALEVSLEGSNKVALRIDYDVIDAPKVSGQLTIRAKTTSAPTIVEQLLKRLRGASAP